MKSPLKNGVNKTVRRMVKDPYSWKRRWTAERTGNKAEVESISRAYIDFLDRARTEREVVNYWVEKLREAGFRELLKVPKRKPRPGEGFFQVNRERSLMAGIAGSHELQEGFNMVATHLDAPRIDLKPLPLDGDFETGIGFMRTHYSGGIKKYHWVNIPLSLHGRVVRGDGSTIDLRIGDDDDDPVLLIPDLLPHLSKRVQDKRKISEAIKGEEMLALAGSGPIQEDTDERPPIVNELLDLLNREYGIIEEDMISSDLSLVPSWSPREIGLDRGLIGAYGHDNRVSSFCAMHSLIDIRKAKKVPIRWAMVMNFDKEEIGSEGNTGAKSQYLELAVYDLLEWKGCTGQRREMIGTLSSSFALCADVKSGMNPTFKSVQDPTNSARLGAGVTITKYTGRGGKTGANDASAEIVGSIRKLFNSEKVVWQMQETGRVDEGGGGTVAKFIATRNIDVLDIGIPILSMHSPFEVVSKMDVGMGYQAFSVFFEKFCR
ncbi:MAG: aminopeptidase [Candidatus Thermoplasmatota archaeon]|nr:aminopeptidase [Candidatus Thermoplasmatota archaeon]